MGLHFSAKAYNVFVFSALSFVSQLEDPPPEAYELEKVALARVAFEATQQRFPDSFSGCGYFPDSSG